MDNRFKIRNVVRRRETRGLRMVATGRHTFKQFVAGKRLLRNQHILISEAELKREADSIFSRVSSGVLQVIAPDGTLITKNPWSSENPTFAIPQAPVVEPVMESVYESEEPPVVGEQEADFTLLPFIGGGRAKKLRSRGLLTYNDVIHLGTDGLTELFGSSFTGEMATNVINKAKELAHEGL